MISDENYKKQVDAQIAQYAGEKDIHITSTTSEYLNNKFYAPRLKKVFGTSHQTEIYAHAIRDAIDRTGVRKVISLGAGDGALEVQIAKMLHEMGYEPFEFLCTELSPVLIDRMRQSVDREGLRTCIKVEMADLNMPFTIVGPVAAVMVNHAIHHFVELEHIFAEIDRILHDEGAFITMDMIGRNGHMRWPEALAITRDLWDVLPDKYKYNHQHGRTYHYYENWDCSIEGFEGIRAQDILPQLLKRFRFEKFCSNLAITDVFAGPSFGPNFNTRDSDDVEFLEQVQQIEDNLIDNGLVKPVQMFAVMRTLRSRTCPAQPSVYNRRTPERALRSIEKGPLVVPRLADSTFINPYNNIPKARPLIQVQRAQTVLFGPDDSGAHMIRWGWYPPEDGLTWAWGIESAMEFQIGSDISKIQLNLHPYPVVNALARTLSVRVNGVETGRFSMEGQGFRLLFIEPAEILRRGERVMVEFADSRPRRPDLDDGPDMRPLSFALASLELY